MKRIFSLALAPWTLIACVLAATLALAADKPDLTGSWEITVESSNGTFHPTAELKQDGEKLTGTYKGALGEGKLEGTVKEKAVEWKVKLDYQGQPLVLAYKGTIESDEAMKGSVELGELGSADWTAKRKKKD